MMLGGRTLGGACLGYGQQKNVLAVDASAYGRHGVYCGAPSLGLPGVITNDIDPAAQFNSSDDFVYVGDDAGFSFPSNIFTIELWYDPLSTDAGEGLLGKRGNPWEYSIYRDGSTLYFKAWSSGGTEVYATTYTLIDLNVHYLVWAADGTNARLYVDAVLKTTVGKSGSSMSNTTAPLILALGGGV